MTRKSLPAIVLTAVGIAAAIWLSLPSQPSAGPSRTAGAGEKAISWLSVARPGRRAFQRDVVFVGRVESLQSVRLTALEDGRVAAISVQDEEPVKKGAMLFRLAGPRIEAHRESLTSNLDSLRSLEEVARRNLKLLGSMAQDGLATNEQIAAAKSSSLELQHEVHAAQAALSAFEERLRIVAPETGVFTDRRVSVGQAVRAGEELGEILDPSHLRVRASLFPPAGAALEGKTATVRIDERRTVAATVKRILPRASSTGAVQVWIEGPAIDAHLRPGATVDGTLQVAAAPSALAVPASAVVYDSEERPLVFVRAKGSYERRAIRTGLRGKGWIEILSGVKQGDDVVVSGAYELYFKRFNLQYRLED